MTTREQRLNNNLSDAYKLLEQFIHHRKYLGSYAGNIAIFFDGDQLDEIISMITDYIGYIHGDLQDKITKRYCDHDQNALMEVYNND